MQGDIEKVAQKSPIELTKFFELISGSDALEPDYNSLQEEMQQTEKKLDALHVKSRLITSRKKRMKEAKDEAETYQQKKHDRVYPLHEGVHVCQAQRQSGQLLPAPMRKLLTESTVMQDNALTNKFLLELFHIRSDYQTARDEHAERQEEVLKLQEEHAEGNSTAELEKELAHLKKQKAVQKRKMDERKRARDQEVQALSAHFPANLFQLVLYRL